MCRAFEPITSGNRPPSTCGLPNCQSVPQAAVSHAVGRARPPHARITLSQVDQFRTEPAPGITGKSHCARVASPPRARPQPRAKTARGLRPAVLGAPLDSHTPPTPPSKPGSTSAPARKQQRWSIDVAQTTTMEHRCCLPEAGRDHKCHRNPASRGRPCRLMTGAPRSWLR